MATLSAHSLGKAGQDWLLSCALHPAEVRQAWADAEFARIPTGPHWRVAQASLAHSVDAVRRIPPGRLGPVLADIYRGTAWWLIPPHVTDELDDLEQLTVHPAGWALQCPPVLYAVRGRWWLEWPDGTGRLTDPTLLGAAFGPSSPQLFAEASA
jgi:hypothetical protein